MNRPRYLETAAPMIAFVLVVLLSAVFSACGKPADFGLGATSRFGQFQSSACFLNKLATQGMGQPIYTLATIQFNSNGTGTNSYRLFDDAGCANEIQSGVNEIRYEIQESDGDTVLIQMDQYDPLNPGTTTRLYIPAFVTDGAYYLDVDYADGESGPYLAVPNSAEIAEFVSDPAVEGVRFRRD